MLTADPNAFVAYARTLAVDAGAACPRGVFLVSPEGFTLATESARDNAYMDLARSVDGARALAQHRGLHHGLAQQLPALCFAGDPATPDAVFPNNVFATAPGQVIIGHMRHPVRRREAERADMRGFFTEVLGYRVCDLRRQPGVCELTGSMVIDRARGLGFCALTERCDATGAAAMHAAFGLRATLMFALHADEYHANVVMSVLASRALVICPEAFVDAAVPAAIAQLYAPHAITLDGAEKAAFAGNCLAPVADTVWLSQAAADGLRPANRAALQHAGFGLRSVPLDEIEKAGGSLRCCIGEIY